MNRAAWLMLAVCWAGLSTGCVTRRVFITSDPPGAAVYRNGQFIGNTPVDEPFIYYGKYHYRIIHDGYEPLDVTPDLLPPWYQLPGIDFVTENLVPYPFRDVQRLHFPLQPEQPVRPDDVRSRAEQMRGEAATIQPPPDAPPRRRPAPAPPAPPTPTLPAPTPSVTAPSGPAASSPGAP